VKYKLHVRRATCSVIFQYETVLTACPSHVAPEQKLTRIAIKDSSAYL
jgi:hypothetical protein